jgi:predicted exporter
LRSQQASLAQLAALDLEAFRRDIEEGSRRVGFRPRVYEPFLKALGAFKEASSRPQYIRFSASESMELRNTVMRCVTGKESDNGEMAFYVRTAIYPAQGGFNPARFMALRRDLGIGLRDLVLIGDPVVEREMAGMIKFNLAVMILLSIATILAALFTHFRRARLAWLTFVPIVAEVLWTCGVMALVGLQIHFFTVLAMPLVLSLAMDNALQLTQYYSDRQPCTVRHAMHSVGRVTALTCAAVALLYGTLGLMSYPGVRDFGLTVLIGAAAVLVGTTMFLPALLQVLGRGQPLAEALTVSGEGETEM